MQASRSSLCKHCLEWNVKHNGRDRAMQNLSEKREQARNHSLCTGDDTPEKKKRKQKQLKFFRWEHGELK